MILSAFLRNLLLLMITVSFVGLVVIFENPFTKQTPVFQPGDSKFITLRSTKYWGIGNQMFALASMVGINKARGEAWKLCLQCRTEARDIFDLDTLPCCASSQLADAGVFSELDFAVYSNGYSTAATDQHLILNGYMQSWKYFRDAAAEVRQLLSFKETVQRAASARLAELVRSHLQCLNCTQNTTLIGVHIRRGDYLSNISQTIGYKAAPLDYIDKAMKHMTQFLAASSQQPRLLFIVSSDDIEWCKRHLKNATDVAFLTKVSDPEHTLLLPRDVGSDLAVLSMCNHTIMTVGTFGWWSAYLADGHVVYYKDALRKMSKLWNGTHHEDVFPPHWVGLS